MDKPPSTSATVPPEKSRSKSPSSLEEGEVIEEPDAEPPAPPPAPAPPPRPRSPWSKRAYGPPTPASAVEPRRPTGPSQPLPPQEREWEREREAQMRERARERDKERERERDVFREREREREQRERDRERERERERERDRDRERELRERELQAQRDREREARERDAQLQRERDAQLQRERDAQLQREARERAQQQERDRELQLQLERERAELMQVDQSPPQPPAQPPARPTEERQLDVTDALSYLDMVKAQFQDMPEIYNQFLDTMKQFKSEQINTPGVIDRVSSLFAGHPRLIEGFNAFLPAGYRIECTTSYITVTTPSGTTKTQPPLPLHTFDQPPPPRLNPSRMGASTPVQAIPVVPASAVTGSSAAAGLPGGPGTPRSMHQEREAMRQQTDRERDREQRERDRREREQRQRQRDWDTQHQLQLQQQLVMPAPIPPTSDPQPPFNAAMEYVNRIKMRFADEPDIYKNFLDILQTYQKGGQGDSVAISHQITVLFRGNQDLIEEFKKFVNTNDDMMGGGGVDMDAERDRPERGDRRRRTTVINAEPPKRKRRVTDRTDVMPATRPPKKPRTDKSEQNQQQWAREPSPPPISHVRGQGHGQNQHHHHHHHAAQVAPLPPPAPPVPDESSFFERLGDPEFTRLARDFAHGDRNVDLRTLVEYLGDTPLGLEFREIVGWGNFMLTDNSNGPTQNGVTMGAGNGSGRLAARVDADEDLGPSYRRLPAADVSRHMSGRDDMCRDVLNDELVSHPSWAPGYASSSPAPPAAEKNAYEKALHRSEDERHEFDYAIDALVRTAVALDAAHQRVQGLPPDERNGHKFKLPLLGSLLKPVHVRTIRRVYGGGGAANDVLQALHDSPNTAIPVVTRRLRHKEDEWKRVQRTWNRVWRAVEAHNFFGSWDHEGAMARARDQEKLSSRALVDELDKARLTRLERRAAILDPGVRAAAEPRVDWSASFECVDVLQDALKLVFAFLGQLPSTSGIEKRRVEGFLRYLVPLVFAGHQDAWDEALGTVDEREEEERLKKKAAKSKKAANGTTNGNTLMLAAADGEPLPAPAAMDIISPLIQPMEIDKRDEIIESPASSTRVLFADRKIYVLLRCLEILYARLAHFSDLAHTLSTVESGSYLDHPLATQLGLTRSLPALAEAYGGSPERFYDVLLESVENVFCGDLAEPAFHANMRMMFGFEAAKLLTLDRLVGAVVKQAQVVLADKRCRHLVALAHQGNEREREAYRRVAEAEAGEDGLVYVRLEGSEMSAVLLMPGDRLPEDTERVDERWQAYMDAYARKKRTEGVKAPSKLPFLNRNLPRNKDAWTRDKSRLSSRRRLEAKVDRYSYRLMFVPGTEEVLARRWSASQLAAACGRAEKLAEERESCVTRFVNKDGA